LQEGEVGGDLELDGAEGHFFFDSVLINF
jgi:hypothetical protein